MAPVAYNAPVRSVVTKPRPAAQSAAPREIGAQAKPAVVPTSVSSLSDEMTSNTQLQWRPVRRGRNAAQSNEMQASANFGPRLAQQAEPAPRDPFEDEFQLPPSLQQVEPTPAAPLEEIPEPLQMPASEPQFQTPVQSQPSQPRTPDFEQPRPREVGPPGERRPQTVPGLGGEGLYYQPRQGDVGMSRDECNTSWEKLHAKTLPTISLDITLAGVEGVDFPLECPLGDTGSTADRAWSEVAFEWKASALCHKPLYFEEVALERYGHSMGVLQPIVSGAHFFGTIPILPYKMGLTPPQECIYALGYYRPGNCAPYMISPLGFTARAGLAQAGAVVGAAAIIP